MRKIRGSMTDAAVPRTGDYWRSQQRLVDALLPVSSAGEKRLPPPMARAGMLFGLFQQVAARQSAQAVETTIAWPALVVDVGAALDAWALGEAVLKQLGALQSQWQDGLAEIFEEMGEIRQANTVSKYVDQEVNLFQQGQALFSNQATAAMQLAENIRVNTVWLLHQHVTGAPRTK